jgi:hypothetical protein
MKLKYLLAASVVSLSAAAILPAPVMAQETTSSVRGTVESDTGPVAGATVTITHVPSGTVQRATTGADGSFTASGLRVGGPFQVAVEAPGFEGAQVDELFLQAGQTFRLPIVVQAQSEIVVTASNLAGARVTSTGPVTTLNRDDIEGVASVSRDIRDIARRDAFVTIDASNARTIEVAGQNGRLNRFSVDGVQLSDDFGINNGGLPTSRGPVPYDAIEQLSVKVAPYDVSEGDFQGGAVNVVLRSGGNRFTGSAFYTYSDDSLTGDKIAGAPVNLEFKSRSYGAFLSGPIFQDKLFFAFAYERLKESDPIDEGPQDAGFAVPIPRITSALANQISEIAKSVYGYDTLGIFSSAAEQDEKFVGKLDWNISDNQRASVTYIRNVGNQQISQNNVTSVTGPTLGFQSNGYELTEEINSGSFQLNSQWSDAFSTELRVSYRDYNRGQNPFGADFAQFEVCTDPTSVNNSAIGNTLTSCGNTLTANPRFFFGPDISRQANQLNTENLSVDLTPRLEAGNHSFKGVIGYTNTDTFNLFLQRATGDLYFDSIADFQARRASRVRLASAVPSLDVNNAAASFSTQTYTVGLQDDWQATDALKLTIGARYDLQDGDTPVPLNPNFLARTGFPNNYTFSGLGVFQPRIGFEWDPRTRFILRGGIGKFAGGAPDVFLSNSFSNTGQLTNSIDIQRTTTAAGCNSGDLTFCNSALLNVSGSTFPASVTQFLATNTGSLAAAPVNAIDPDYRLPAQWRSTLSASYEANLGPLGDGWLFGADLLYGWTAAANTYVDLRSVQIGTLPDGRPRYGRTTQGILPGDTNQTNQDLVLTSTGQGRSIVGVVRFEKNWDWGLGIGASYTRADIKDVNPITSATAGSLYGNAAMADPNNAAYGRSIYEFTNSVKFNVDFDREFFGDYGTRIAIFGEWRNGRPFSYTMRDPSTGRAAVFGTNGSNTRYLLYVPTGTTDPLVSYDTATTQTALDNLINSTKLADYRGQIAPKNLGTSPGYWKVDLHAEQELPTFIGGSRIKLFGDIENVLNLLDSDWGVQRQVNFAYFAPVVNVQCLTAAVPTGTTPTAAQVNTASNQTCAQYRYASYADPNIVVQNQNKQSLYQIRVGVRFEF